MKWVKKGFIYKPENENDWWKTHSLAPSAIELANGDIRVFMGGEDEKRISRIGYIDVDSDDPTQIKQISPQPSLDLGEVGNFDDNGVFPGHAYIHNGKIYLYYTGFQLFEDIPYTNLGGLAISEDGGDVFKRVSQAPILGKAVEGKSVRAGQSILVENDNFRSCYSAGNKWEEVGGKMRPTYDVYYQDSPDGISYQDAGVKIFECNHSVEHGLGRPQITKIGNNYYIFYTRRTLDMQYHLGCAKSEDCKNWQRIDEWVALPHGGEGEFDSEMVYFPSVLATSKGRTYLFYCGNTFGKEGFGYAELEN